MLNINIMEVWETKQRNNYDFISDNHGIACTRRKINEYQVSLIVKTRESAFGVTDSCSFDKTKRASAGNMTIVVPSCQKVPKKKQRAFTTHQKMLNVKASY